ncbi:MAG: putative bifunctional diguanylate cyclase/phosphodiesterase [Parvibaculaceae bacterium]
MSSARKGKIGRRIVLLVLTSVSLSLVTLTAAFLWLQLRDNVDARRASIQATAYVFASAIADHVAERNDREVFGALRSIRQVPDVSRVVALDAEGRQIAALGAASMLQTDIVDESAGWYALLTRGWFPVVTDIVKAGRSVGRLVIIADVSDLRSQVMRAMLVTMLGALLAGGVGITAALRLQRRITAPIASLTDAMTHIREARDYSTKVEHQSDDETGILVDAFNGMMGEIGERDAALNQLAFFDPLTGLPNRQQFLQRLEEILGNVRDENFAAALFLLDLDEFKSVNDSFGHSAGDALLEKVTARFEVECTAGTVLARLGGDEFALIVPGPADEDAAQQAVVPFLAALLKPVDLNGREILASASVGAALVPRDGEAAADLLRRADLALYSAKREGRARVHFYRPQLEADMQSLMALGQDLRQAIAQGELEAYYQPQVDVRTGGIAGFESLLRWKHPVQGYISPGKFIPVAESNGLICDLGHWILRESCAQARAWLDQGLETGTMSVNVSVAQLQQLRFEDEVRAVLAETGLPGSRLCLELTESLFAGHSLQRIRELLTSLKTLGVHLAIDDFGTGYSSLAYLQGFPFDKIKIDRAFVSGVGSNPEKRRLLRGMMELAHALDLSTVAEGAETEDELAVLQELGADSVQGYVHSKPVPAAQAEAFVRRLVDEREARHVAVGA